MRLAAFWDKDACVDESESGPVLPLVRFSLCPPGDEVCRLESAADRERVLTDLGYGRAELIESAPIVGSVEVYANCFTLPKFNTFLAHGPLTVMPSADEIAGHKCSNDKHSRSVVH